MPSGIPAHGPLLDVPDVDGSNREWMRHAACKASSPNLFMVDGHQPQGEAAAKRVCSTCVVQTSCLGYALADPDLIGIWGGTTKPERVEMRKRRR